MPATRTLLDEYLAKEPSGGPHSNIRRDWRMSVLCVITHGLPFSLTDLDSMLVRGKKIHAIMGIKTFDSLRGVLRVSATNHPDDYLHRFRLPSEAHETRYIFDWNKAFLAKVFPDFSQEDFDRRNQQRLQDACKQWGVNGSFSLDLGTRPTRRGREIAFPITRGSRFISVLLAHGFAGDSPLFTSSEKRAARTNDRAHRIFRYDPSYWNSEEEDAPANTDTETEPEVDEVDDSPISSQDQLNILTARLDEETRALGASEDALTSNRERLENYKQLVSENEQDVSRKKTQIANLREDIDLLRQQIASDQKVDEILTDIDSLSEAARKKILDRLQN